MLEGLINKPINIRVISVGTDRNLFSSVSAVTERTKELGEVFGELHIIVFTLDVMGFSPTQIGKNIFIYPTNSRSKSGYILDALRIASGIAGNIYYGQTVVTTQDPFECGLVGWLIKKKTKLPLQLQIHTDLFSPYFYNSTWMNFLRVGIARFLIPRADNIRVVSKKIAIDILKKYKKIPESRFAVLPIYVDLKKVEDDLIAVNLRQKYKQWDKIVLMVSRLAPEKNIELGLQAFNKVSEQYPKTGMVIVGSGPEIEGLVKLAGKLKLEGKVIFEEWQQNVISYMKSAHVFLNTSLFEGYGMTLVEAAASGAVIVTSDVGVAQEFIRDGENGFVCPVNDRKCFETKLLNVIGNSALIETVGKRAKEEIIQHVFTKEEYLEKYKKSIESIAGRSS